MLTLSRPMTASEGLTNYFVGKGETEEYYLSSPGQWFGKGAELLGFAEGSEVSREDFAHVAQGAGLVTRKADAPNKRAGIDLTISAPKSISIMGFLDREEGKKIQAIREKAASNVFRYIEKNYSHTRVMAGGKREVVTTGNMVMARFKHGTSRDLDPQAHEHYFLFNLTQGPDDQWRSTEVASLFHDQKKLGQLFRNEEVSLLREAGYAIEITDHKEGFYRLKGMPEAVEELFSKRNAAIEAQLKDPEFQKMIEEKYPSASPSKIKQLAAFGTRRAKENLSEATLEASWRDELKQAKYDPAQIRQDILREKGKNLERPVLQAREAVEVAISGITSTEATFTRTEALARASMLELGTKSFKELEEGFAALDSTLPAEKTPQDGRSEETVLLGKGQFGRFVGHEVYTTVSMQEAEKRVIRNVTNGKGSQEGIATAEEVSKFLDQMEAHKSKQHRKEFKYTDEQRHMVTAILAGSNHIPVIQGDAGTGKTAAMEAIRVFAERKEIPILGVGFTGKAASQMLADSGIKSQTIASFLHTNPMVVGAHPKGQEQGQHQPTTEQGKKEDQEARREAQGVEARQEQHPRQESHQEARTALKSENQQPAAAGEKKRAGINTGWLSFGPYQEKQGKDRSFQTRNWNGSTTTYTVFGANAGQIKNTFSHEFLGVRYGSTHTKNRDGSVTLTKWRMVGGQVETTEFKVLKEGRNPMAGKVRPILAVRLTEDGHLTYKLRNERGTNLYYKTNGQQSIRLANGVLLNNLEIGTGAEQAREWNPGRERTLTQSSPAKGQDAKQQADQGQKDPAQDAKWLKSFSQLNPHQGGKPQAIILMDESSMTSSKDMDEMTSWAVEHGVRMPIVGDMKQLKSVGAGKIFQDIQQTVGVDVELTNVRRQQTELAKNVVKEFSSGNTGWAMNALEQAGQLREYKSRKDLLRAASQAYAQARNQGESVMVITDTNTDRQQINQVIRAGLVAKGQVEEGKEFSVRTNADIRPDKRQFASSYEEGMAVVFNKETGKLKAGTQGVILAADAKENTLTVKVNKTEHKVSLKESFDGLSAFKKETRNFAKDDRIVFGKNDKQLNVANSTIGVIESIDRRGNAAVKIGEDRTVNVRLGEGGYAKDGDAPTYPYVDHAYAVTAHKVQGETMQSVVYVPDLKRTDRSAMYVAITRAKNNITVLTNNKEKLKERVKLTKEKSSTLSFMANLKAKGQQRQNVQQQDMELSR